MIRLFACDLDGTLLNQRHETDEIILSAIDQTIENGCYFAVATGRHMHYKQREEMGFAEREVYTVGMNGAVILNPQGSILFEQPIDPNIILRLIWTFPQIDFEFVGIDHTYMQCSQKDYVSKFQQRSIWGKVTSRFKVEQFVEDCCFDITVEELLQRKIYKINFRISDPVLKKQMLDFIESHRDYLTNAPYDSDMFELTEHSVNKGEAVAFLAHYLKVSEEDTAVYGDGGNDIEMLARFKHSYAPETAILSAKEAADQIIGSGEEHAVALHIIKTLKERGGYDSGN